MSLTILPVSLLSRSIRTSSATANASCQPLAAASIRRPRQRRWQRMFGVLVAASIAGMTQPLLGQGGATMSAGQSMQNSANAAADQTNRSLGGTPPVSGTPELATPPADPSGLGGYPGSQPYSSADFPGSGYPGSSYGPGAGGGLGPGRSGRAPGSSSGMIAGGIAGSVAEFFNRPLPSGESLQPSIFEQAALAAHRGDLKTALTLYHAHLLAERESAAQALSSVRFSPMLRRPVWALRLGVSINTRTPADLADDPQPVRDEDDKSPRRGRNQSASTADYGYESSGSLEQPGNSSAPLLGADSLAPGSLPPGPATPAGLSSNAAVAETAAEPQLGSADIQELLDRDLGLVAEVVSAQLTRRLREGRFGTAITELTAKGATLAEKMPGRSTTSDSQPMWLTGVEFVGSGIATQVIEKARASQIDLLVHFEVIAKPIQRSEESQYQARCRVVNVATGETLGASKLIDRREVTLAARRSNVRAVVDELLEPALKALDAKGSVAQMPALTPQQALARIDTLLSSPTSSRMINLAEMVMFHQRGLIDEDQLQQAVYYAAGDDGLLLLYADYDQRREVAQRMVAQELGQK